LEESLIRKAILLVEDDTENRHVIGHVLRTEGYSVIEAKTGKEAAEACAQGTRIDLLVADIVLPDRSGTEIALDISKSCPDVPVVFISGTPLSGWSKNDLANFRRLRPESVAFLAKPFFPVDLRVTVRKLLEESTNTAV
jgi:two-component system cell cycle sensor histidine kinase/response regulator CckA